MANKQNISIQIFGIIICVMALCINFLVTGILHFTLIHWVAVGLTSAGLLVNILTLYNKFEERGDSLD